MTTIMRAPNLLDSLGGVQRSLIRSILKINPTYTKDAETVKFGWKEFYAHSSLINILLAVVTVATVFPCVVWLLLNLPGGEISVVGSVMTMVNKILQLIFQTTYDYTSEIFAVVFFLLTFYSDKITTVIGSWKEVLGDLPQFAMNEEVAFRKGTENLTLGQKIQNCFSFGLVHFMMLVVPVAALPGLMIGGGMFMLIYGITYHRTKSQEKALVRSATVHTTYNIIVLTIGITSILTLAVTGLILQILKLVVQIL